MGRDRDGIDRRVAILILKAFEDEPPQSIDVEMWIETIPNDRIRPCPDSEFPLRDDIDQRNLRVGLADINDLDVAHQVIWKTVTSGTATGSLSGFVSMISAIYAHQRFMTGWRGRSSIA